MIVWGAKSVVRDLGQQGIRPCPTCEKERPFHLMLQYTQRHISFVFRWVAGKQYASVCHVCQRGEKLDAKAVERSLAKPPIPWFARRSWTVLATLVLLVGVFDIMGNSGRTRDRDAYLAAPKPGDAYVVNINSLLKTPDGKPMHGVLRVRRVNADSVEFDAGTFFYSGVNSPTQDIHDRKLDQPGYFSPKPIVLTRAELARIQSEHAIHTIWRF